MYKQQYTNVSNTSYFEERERERCFAKNRRTKLMRERERYKGTAAVKEKRSVLQEGERIWAIQNRIGMCHLKASYSTSIQYSCSRETSR